MSDDKTLAFTVEDMTCGHCARTITGAVLAAYPAARVDIDLAAKRVSIKMPATARPSLPSSRRRAIRRSMPDASKRRLTLT